MSKTCLLYHIVFRPKDNVPAILTTSEEILYRYIWKVVKTEGGILYAIGGMPDHIHILVNLPATIALADFMRITKTATSKFMIMSPSSFPTFGGWAKGYFCETISYSQKDAVCAYIKGQKSHHRKATFLDELKLLCTDNGFDISPYLLSDV